MKDKQGSDEGHPVDLQHNNLEKRRVTVPKVKLIDAIKANRDKHRDLFLKAQAGYRVEAVKRLDEALKLARDGHAFDLHQLAYMPVPEDHTNDYERVIRMLEMSTAEVVTIGEQQFSEYVLDDWGWKDKWTTSNSGYGIGQAR